MTSELIRCSYGFILQMFVLIYIISQSPTTSFISILKSYPRVQTQGLWSPSVQTRGIYGNLTLAHTGSLNVPTPSYAQILTDGILSVTSFSLLRKGSIMQFDLNDISKHRTLKGDYLWPNELTTFRHRSGQEVLLVPDGFLMPGQSNGGLYAIINPHGLKKHHPIRITKEKNGWFYHRAVYVSLPGGINGIITARAHKPLFGQGRGELVWISIPDNIESKSDDPYSANGGFDTSWDEVVLATGPDVMFEVLDTNIIDKTVDIVAAHFFSEKLSIHTIQATKEYPYVKVVKSSSIHTVGKPYGLTLASFSSNEDFDSNDSSDGNRHHSHLLVSTHECSYDLVSMVDMALSAISGLFPRIRTGSRRGGVRDGEFLPVENGVNAEATNKGGSLFAYKLPDQKESSLTNKVEYDHRDQEDSIATWKRQTLFRGFKVRGWGGIFSPGAPGFPYVIRTAHSEQPFIMLAGDCTGSAYIFAPSQPISERMKASSLSKTGVSDKKPNPDLIPEYDLAFEVECGATVGSLAVKTNADDSLNIYVPSYELNKIHVFHLSNINHE